MKIKDLQEKYKDQWIIVKPTELDEFGQVCEGDLLAVGDTSEEAMNQVNLKKHKQTAQFFTGKVPPMMYGGAPITRKPEDLDI